MTEVRDEQASTQGSSPLASGLPTLTVNHVAEATGCPHANVAASWPTILAALVEFGIASMAVQIAVAATVAVETSIFMPIRERRASQQRQPWLYEQQARYWGSGYYGRGFVQLTWEHNYEENGEALGVDLVGNPDLALDPTTAARILARFFKVHGVAQAADAGEWTRVRKLVNGGTNGLDDFLKFVKALQGPVAA